jgi:hypothetical protein
MRAYTISVFSGINGGSETATIDLGSAQNFYAWCQINMIDSLADFDRDNAVVLEIYQVDGVETWKVIYGGDHFGSEGSSANVHTGAMSGYGRRITFRMRAMHSADLSAFGTGIVLVP